VAFSRLGREAFERWRETETGQAYTGAFEALPTPPCRLPPRRTTRSGKRS
jgi:hypothetical protein